MPHSFYTNEPLGADEEPDANSGNPQPGETWEHQHLGFVKVLRRWNDKECVCEGANPKVGTRILCDCFLTRPATQQNQ